MKDIIETLYPMNATLLGEGYDSRLEYLKHLLDLEVLEFPTGTKLETWEVPEEWVVRDAWVKYKGKKIIDFKKEPLSLITYSLPFKGTVTDEELKKHLHFSEEHPEKIPHVFKFYERDWGFCVTGKQAELKKGEYEVFIDTEFKPGIMKVGVHTIQGKLDKEILLFAHLDHPYQANDNLSGVACLVDLATKIKSDYTIKIIFCPETIGSHAYALTQDISKVEFVIAVDICGTNGSLLLQKAFNKNHKLNKIAHLALQNLGENYRKGDFRMLIGSDENTFNDPLIGIPGIMLSTWDTQWEDYHTNTDTPDKVNYEKIGKTQEAILKIIELYEQDRVPVKKFKGPLMRSKYGIHTPFKNLNLSYDYLFYNMDGKNSVVELCCDLALNFEHTMGFLNKMEQDGIISWADSSQGDK